MTKIGDSDFEVIMDDEGQVTRVDVTSRGGPGHLQALKDSMKFIEIPTEHTPGAITHTFAEPIPTLIVQPDITFKYENGTMTIEGTVKGEDAQEYVERLRDLFMDWPPKI